MPILRTTCYQKWNIRFVDSTVTFF